MPSKCILLINQDADTVRICTDLFAAHGFEVLSVEGTEEALRVARTETPAVIVAELIAPTETGWEIIQVLKSDPELAGIPLVAFTSFALADDRRRARSADLFLAKPADLESILSAVERLAGGRERP